MGKNLFNINITLEIDQTVIGFAMDKSLFQKHTRIISSRARGKGIYFLAKKRLEKEPSPCRLRSPRRSIIALETFSSWCRGTTREVKCPVGVPGILFLRRPHVQQEKFSAIGQSLRRSSSFSSRRRLQQHSPHLHRPHRSCTRQRRC